MPKLRAEVQRAVDDVGRRMRWDSAENLARSFVSDVFAEWEKFVKDMYSLLRDISEDTEVAEGRFPAYSTLIRQEREKKDFDPAQTASILTRLSTYIGPEKTAQVEALIRQLAPKMIDTPNPLTDSDAVFNRHYPGVIQDGWDKATENLYENARIQGEVERLEQAIAGRVINFGAGFVNEIYDRGFQYVTSKITYSVLGEVADSIVRGLDAGRTWKEIATRIHQRVGTGYLYHWQRLVRTEMTFAYYTTFTERYEQAGAQFVQLSVSMGACPICVGLKGYYRMGDQPRIPLETHPNCRCIYTPYFRLPEGVELAR